MPAENDVTETPAEPKRQLVAVLGASGGCGASTLAVNLAAAFAKERTKAILVDLKPGRGDLASLLDLRPKKHLVDACREVDSLTSQIVERMLAKHSSGIHLLGASSNFLDARSLFADGVSATLDLLGEICPDVVVDLEDCFHDEQVAALQLATSILIVARPDFTSLRNARRIVEHLTAIDVAPTIARVVVNRDGQEGELTRIEAEDALGGKYQWTVPDDPAHFNASNNTGMPLVVKYPKSTAAAAILAIAGVGAPREAPRRRSFASLLAPQFGSLFGD